MRRHGTIIRTATGPEGSFGRFELDDGWGCVSGELPWRRNQPGVSCIPPGTYEALLFDSTKHGLVYRLEMVPGRSDVEIHAANWMGDETLGFQCQLQGCIALGLHLGELIGQKALIDSRAAMLEFTRRLGGNPLCITIREEYQ